MMRMPTVQAVHPPNMSAVPADQKSRLGRPPSTNSADTHDRILLVARQAFSELGYGVTTNKDVAGRAGITTGALYHYFDSKVAMYWAVFDQVQKAVGAHIALAIQPFTTFLTQVEAFFHALTDLNRLDPSLADFLNAARIDITRYEELTAHFTDTYPHVRRHFIPGLVELGIATGEIHESRRKHMSDFLHAFATGVMDPSAVSHHEHERAVTALLELLKGQLIHQPKIS